MNNFSGFCVNTTNFPYTGLATSASYGNFNYYPENPELAELKQRVATLSLELKSIRQMLILQELEWRLQVSVLARLVMSYLQPEENFL